MKKTKIVVYALSTANHIKDYGVRRIESLKHIKTKHNIDIKIFIDQDQSLEYQQLFDSNVEFVDIRKNLTPNLRKLPYIDSVISGKRPIRYRGMCLFNFSEFIHYMQDYDYVIRLDGDSIICSDLFLDDFIDGDNIYGYLKDVLDRHKPTLETLPLAIKKYIDNNDIRIYCDREKINNYNFYNNFHISKLSFWQKPEVLDFINFIHQENGIAKHRWGDSTIQANLVRMFCPSEKIYKFDFKYEHGSHGFKNFK
jgi:hypothetical protein